jgi:hypothetical protein
VRTGIEYHDLPTGHDQIIIEKKWYPVNSELIQSAKDWLISHGLLENESISIGKLIELRSADELPVKLIDESIVIASDFASMEGRLVGKIRRYHGNHQRRKQANSYGRFRNERIGK